MKVKRNNELDKNGPIPLYSQLKGEIINRIQKGEYKVNDRLPSEKELMEIFGISRTTVRQAVDLLVQEGYLEIRRGIGTFVSKPKYNVWELEELRSFEDEVGRKGLKTETQALGLEIVNINSELKNIYSDKYNKFYKLTRLRFVERQPSILVTTFVPYDIAPGLEKYNFSAVSLFSILKEDYHIRIDYAKKTFRAINVNKEDAKLLNIKEGTAIQLVKTITYNTDGYPFEFSISRDRGDITRFSAVLKYKQ